MSKQNFDFTEYSPKIWVSIIRTSWLTKLIFFFSRLYFSALIRTKIESINNQLVVDINWPSKAI